MAKVPVYNETGKEQGELELDDSVFGVKAKLSLIHQVFEAILSNARQPWAHTKDKSEVRGGGRKPWKQKGTGRARHGSIRSPIWKGGGVTFGPLNRRNYKKKINRKMSQKAIKAVLSDKVNNGSLLVVEHFPKDGKTKSVDTLRNNLPGFGKTTIFVMGESNLNFLNASRNVQKLDVQRAIDLNVADLLTHQYLVMDKSAVEVILERLTK